MAGINDMNAPTASKTAPDQLGSLIDEIISAAPDTTVLVAQLVPSTNEITAKNSGTFNEAVPWIAATRANSKKKVMVVNMTRYVTTDGLSDMLHSNVSRWTKEAVVIITCLCGLLFRSFGAIRFITPQILINAYFELPRIIRTRYLKDWRSIHLESLQFPPQ